MSIDSGGIYKFFWIFPAMCTKLFFPERQQSLPAYLLCRQACVLFAVCGSNLADIRSVVGIFSEELCRNSVVCEEAGFFHVIAVKLAADEYEVSLIESHTAVSFNRSKTGFLYLVAVSAGM